MVKPVDSTKRSASLAERIREEYENEAFHPLDRPGISARNSEHWSGPVYIARGIETISKTGRLQHVSCQGAGGKPGVLPAEIAQHEKAITPPI